jgi:hypothetical protein
MQQMKENMSFNQKTKQPTDCHLPGEGPWSSTRHAVPPYPRPRPPAGVVKRCCSTPPGHQPGGMLRGQTRASYRRGESWPQKLGPENSCVVGLGETRCHPATSRGELGAPGERPGGELGATPGSDPGGGNLAAPSHPGTADPRGNGEPVTRLVPLPTAGGRHVGEN